MGITAGSPGRLPDDNLGIKAPNKCNTLHILTGRARADECRQLDFRCICRARLQAGREYKKEA
jgi:hypothetical protein